MEKRDELIKIFSLNIRTILEQINIDFGLVQEIRLRVQAPIMLVYKNEEFYMGKDGTINKDRDSAYTVTKNELRETMEYISNYSLYAYEEELRQGFITIQGGHRIGLAGKVIQEENIIKSMKYISFINIRISHEIKGCADKIMPYVIEGKQMKHTLIISPPRCGKTTLLRDLVRQLSNGTKDHVGMAVGVVDERSEIGACYMGVPQNDLGIRTDVLDCCPKAIGMLMLIRSMSPQVIAVDEIGSREDINAIAYVINCGCKLIATVHGTSIEDIRSKPILSELIKEGIFERFIILDNKSKVGNICQIYDSKGNVLYKGGEVHDS